MPRLRDYTGPAIFSYGFRPFFLFGSIYAAFAVMVWLPVFHGHFDLVTAFAPRDWHVHEMLFGYAAAVVAGFMLTAIPNSRDRADLCGRAARSHDDIPADCRICLGHRVCRFCCRLREGPVRATTGLMRNLQFASRLSW